MANLASASVEFSRAKQAQETSKKTGKLRQRARFKDCSDRTGARMHVAAKANVAAKHRASKEAHDEVSERASTCHDVGSMTHFDSSMTRAQIIAKGLGISLEEAASL